MDVKRGPVVVIELTKGTEGLKKKCPFLNVPHLSSMSSSILNVPNPSLILHISLMSFIYP